jgi:hypothetical protein
MMEWLYPAALVGLAATAGPILVHLLRRQRATRLPFPSLRFLGETHTAAVRPRLPSDALLLVIRIGTVAAAALALAQPIVRTDARRRAWLERIVRVVVLDTSRSMEAGLAAAREAAGSEVGGSAEAQRIEAGDLAAGMARAVRRLPEMGPGRREIVVVSDFQLGSLDAAALSLVPAHVGLRFVSAGQPQPTTTFAQRLLGTPGRVPREETVTLTPTATSVTVRTTASETKGLRIVAPAADRPDADRLLRAVARAGAPEPSADERLAFVFPGVPAPAIRTPNTAWMLRTIAGVREQLSSLVQQGAPNDETGDGWLVAMRDPSGRPLVSAGAGDGELIFRIERPPREFVAVATVGAALRARVRDRDRREHEIARIPASQLAGWTRAPGAPPPDQWREEPPGDARYFWTLALVLLLVEFAVRRTSRLHPVEAARAA